jgi:hypothetical protein
MVVNLVASPSFCIVINIVVNIVVNIVDNIVVYTTCLLVSIA